ncbi:MAG: hypothetical protein Fur0037_29440 [Planctomycetota bacterium]
MLISELARKLARTADLDPLGRELTRAAERKDRKMRANSASFAAAARHLESGIRDERDVPLDVVYEAGRDAREDHPDFRRLPPEEQEALRMQWEEERRRATLRPRRVVLERLRLFGLALILYAVVGGILIPFQGVANIPDMLLSGALTGATWLLLNPTRFSLAITGAVVLLVYKGIGLCAASPDTASAAEQSMTILFTVAVITFGCGMIGFDCELRRTGGFKARGAD